MNYCPTCRRRHRPRSVKPLAPLLLFEWQPTRSSVAVEATSRPAPTPRLVLLHHCPSPEGEPRPGILYPGKPVPRAFTSMAAALAALRQMEARR